ncbi:DUF4065 domain-containing protein [Treponema phagedenis]|uniref:Panacea domain-containing protein n=1 Tax=Treponema phagedenis TaxID=162 RepID=UPI0001F63BFD|nr:type II toxin-antitoxin system antitoxin SocA domain-containing protein [Treponema phagedenis]EFW38142.1 hypothetical protein HMPREF9554_01355 [Treponema phagedenis F0421]QSH98954.1 DUF4065 domain-containing protein [Treponema phagedenis]TYT77844.1 DUF4065 domain-containing protein [Treponema phagedenis]TYT78029.1 DUF4065 domain-containing protein [Treponema phagedenis]
MEAMVVAQYIINRCTIEGNPISNLQLQKILYYVQVACLQELGEPCFDDPIEAWQFGPVVRAVYYQYCGFGAFPIDWEYDSIISDSRKKTIIDTVIDEKKNLPPWALVFDDYSPGKAWSRVYKNNSPKATISLRDMRLYG